MLKDELYSKSREEGLAVKTLEKEALQIYVLSELFALPESVKFAFQGGTCLRLIYGGPRYSEDLDFITSASRRELEGAVQKLQDSLPKLAPLFGGRFELAEQKATGTFFRFKVHNRRENFHDSFFVSLEFARYPAYTINIAPLRPQKELPGLPLTIVRAETLEEILADKVCAVAGRPFCKGRDIFDLWFLKQKGIILDPKLLINKFKDYHTSPQDLKKGLSLFSAEKLKAEMDRFLPLQYRRQFEANNYSSLLTQAQAVIQEGISLL